MYSSLGSRYSDGGGVATVYIIFIWRRKHWNGIIVLVLLPVHFSHQTDYMVCLFVDFRTLSAIPHSAILLGSSISLPPSLPIHIIIIRHTQLWNRYEFLIIFYVFFLDCKLFHFFFVFFSLKNIFSFSLFFLIKLIYINKHVLN